MNALTDEQQARLNAMIDDHIQQELDACARRRLIRQDAIDRRAEFVARMGAVGLGLAALAVLALAVKWATS